MCRWWEVARPLFFTPLGRSRRTGGRGVPPLLGVLAANPRRISRRRRVLNNSSITEDSFSQSGTMYVFEEELSATLLFFVVFEWSRFAGNF